MISEDQALAIVRARAQSNGWPLIEPLAIQLRKSWWGKGGRYEIVTNPLIRGANSRFTIDAVTGEVLSEGHISR